MLIGYRGLEPHFIQYTGRIKATYLYTQTHIDSIAPIIYVRQFLGGAEKRRIK